MSNLSSCKGCGRPFFFKPGKKFHSGACSDGYYKRKKAEQSAVLWSTLVEHRLPEEAIAELDAGARVRVAITHLAPGDAVYYRLGCPKPELLDLEKLKVLWFPSRLQRHPALFTLEPYAEPEVPCPGLYAVAYFDKDGTLIGTPMHKIEIPFWHRLLRWSLGDESLALKSGL